LPAAADYALSRAAAAAILSANSAPAPRPGSAPPAGNSAAPAPRT